MRADLQRYYGLDIGRLGSGLDVFHAASCFACLPMGSATAAAQDPACALTMEGHILYKILDMLTNDGHYPRFWEEQLHTDGLPELGALPVDEFEKWYSNKFKEVDAWQIQ